MNRIKVALLFGGRSGEHEVSRNSANTVAKALHKNFDVFPIGIAKDGQWYGPIDVNDIKDFSPTKYCDKKLTILPFPQNRGIIYSIPALKQVTEVDVFFPILHGTYGEDGTLQGLLELAQVPYVGPGVLASSAGMDKLIMKAIFAHAGLPQVKYLGVLRKTIEDNISQCIDDIEVNIGYPCFVKPANLGSSVGISKAQNRKELEKSLNVAALYDRKIIVEQGVIAREIEVSILGNDNPQASLPGEIVPGNDFYDYKAKYIDDNSVLFIPADISEDNINKIQEYAIAAYNAIDCAGLARIDFFITKDSGEILINEINTLPGFTSISMYPKLWEHTGINIGDLTANLITLAFERANDKEKNLTSFEA